jgi:hypothetical protein
MELTQYHKLRAGVQANAAPGSSRALRDVQQNLELALASVGLFSDVEVGYTDDVDSLVIAMCTFPEELSEAEVARRLELLWKDRLRYGFWEAHAMLVDEGQVELEAATRSAQDGHYVTVHVVAQKGFVPAQRVAVD